MLSATPAEIAQAAQRLLAGELVAFPTETVYGLGADADNPQAVARIYALKGRPANHPVIVHLPVGADIHYWVDHVPDEAQRLMQAFWPGPLTLILPRAPHIPDAVSGGQQSIGLRCPSHPVAQALLQAFATMKPNGAVAAPSANRFGQVSPTTAAHVVSEFSDAVAQGLPVLQGGAAHIGIESTIVDVSRCHQGVPATLLRPGHITVAALAQVLGYVPLRPDASAPRASGTLKAHYAPHTPLQLAPTDWWALSVPAAQTWAVMTIGTPPCQPKPGWQCYSMPSDPVGYAHHLYAQLRTMDASGADRLWVTPLPSGTEWDGVRDRLTRALAAFALPKTPE